MTVTDTAYYMNGRPEMRPFLPENRSRLLEIGCGQGVFVSTIDGVTDSWAVEAEPEAAAVAQSRFSHVLCGLFDQVSGQLPKAYFDLVICNDVIEHMIDHDQFLSDIKDHIAPGGYLVGSIPNVRYYRNIFELLFEKDWHYRDSGILDRTHLRFFTEKSWRKALARAGFTVDAMAGINPYPDRWSARDRFYAGLAKGVAALSLGRASDIVYLQFGFRAKVKP